MAGRSRASRPSSSIAPRTSGGNSAGCWNSLRRKLAPTASLSHVFPRRLGKQVTDPKQRNDIYCQASKKIWDDAPIIFLWNQLFPIVYRSTVTNIDYLPNEEFVAIYARPAK